ncbi:LysR family transcriptional regulator [Virgibacillus oceani]|uniref:HTH-type transcriptional regulator CitR n=1 Tax=Virgibacillus oceani TaxID=1479511 RepID=A0A917H3A9_9BACI|nr:LysR family transcriptional regulator [Virgibacillus oceani]GGG65840.1 HTH-type transcriptional regulator CitR [Virgibacillus oceani]
MDTRIMQTFLLAAKYENFRMVAEKLYITQPAVTFQIRQLEEELGGKLFNKYGRNIQLTEFGRLFEKEAKEMIAQYEKSITRLNSFQQGFQRTIRVAISPLMAETILPSILVRYTKTFPNVELSIEVLESIKISDAVEKGEVDLGLSCLPGFPTIKSLKLHEESVSLVCRHDGYDSETGPIIDAQNLLESTIIFTDNHPTYWERLKEQLKTSLSTYKLMKVNQSYVTKRFVLEGIGVSFLPKSIINREILEGRLLEVPAPFLTLPTANMYILYKYEQQMESDFVKFISNFYIS